MGTNYYLMSKSKKLMREYFAVETDYGTTDEEYEIVDEPYLGYQVHLNKLSAGWRPLFQKHKTIKTFKELEEFCLNNNNVVGIYDEYGRKYSWQQYFDRVYSHSQRQPEPFKWVYEIDPVLRIVNKQCKLYPVQSRRRRYICRSAIEYMKKKKSRLVSVLRYMKDLGLG